MILYNDIISCHRPLSRHIPMERAHRAKQFAPFAALKGYEQSIEQRSLLQEVMIETEQSRSTPEMISFF